MTFNDVVSVGFLSKPDAAGGIWCPTQSEQDSQTCAGTSDYLRQKAYVVAVSRCGVILFVVSCVSKSPLLTCWMGVHLVQWKDR